MSVKDSTDSVFLSKYKFFFIDLITLSKFYVTNYYNVDAETFIKILAFFILKTYMEPYESLDMANILMGKISPESLSVGNITLADIISEDFSNFYLSEEDISIIINIKKCFVYARILTAMLDKSFIKDTETFSNELAQFNKYLKKKKNEGPYVYDYDINIFSSGLDQFNKKRSENYLKNTIARIDPNYFLKNNLSVNGGEEKKKGVFSDKEVVVQESDILVQINSLKNKIELNSNILNKIKLEINSLYEKILLHKTFKNPFFSDKIFMQPLHQKYPIVDEFEQEFKVY